MPNYFQGSRPPAGGASWIRNSIKSSVRTLAAGAARAPGLCFAFLDALARLEGRGPQLFQLLLGGVVGRLSAALKAKIRTMLGADPNELS
jgi:hypothetical protein